jgi:3-deoxy-D-manno-octulosonic-acid transferase
MVDTVLQTTSKRILLQLMGILYNIGIYGLGLSLRIASIFNAKAKLWVSGRKNLYAEIPNTKGKQVIWFHCASLGEFDQGLPLMEKLKQQDTSLFILVTFFSPSGMQHYHKRKHTADFVMYLPLDTKSNARKFFAHFQPTKAFFVKYEFWSNFIFEAKKNNVLLYNVSGIFRPKHRYFKWYGGYFRKTLKAFEWFFVQNRASLELLKSIDIVNVSISGDSRFDRVLDNKKQVVKNEIIEAFKGNEALFVIGSSWPEDEKIIIPFLKNYTGKTLIAPHNIDESYIQNIINQLPNTIRYSKLKKNEIVSSNILILDTIGQLSNAYSYGSFAYIGGGFSGNLHNILEPAVFGLPVIFGPKHIRFPEAQAFIDHEIGISVSTAEEFQTAFDMLNQNLTELSQKTTKFIEENKGASDKIILRITAS